MAAARAERTQTCDASAEACFDARADIAASPDWLSAVTGVDVRERDAEGRAAVVEFRTDAKLREVRYTLRYHFDRPRRISSDYLGGDAKRVENEFLLEPDGAGTRVTYRIDVDAGGPLVPGRIKQSLAEQAVRSTLAALKRRLAAG